MPTTDFAGETWCLAIELKAACENLTMDRRRHCERCGAHASGAARCASCGELPTSP